MIPQADVIIGMELSDYRGTVNGFVDNGNDGWGYSAASIKPGTKLISISGVDLLPSRTSPSTIESIDISMPADAEATLPSLIEAVKSAIGNDRKDAIGKATASARRT